MDNIILENISPKYFTPRNVEQSEIWKKNIAFPKGKKILIVAPSGSGKSTLATAILGTHFQYEGDIKYDQQIVKTLHLEKIVENRKDGVSLLFQDVRLIKNLTISENILLRIFNKDKKKFIPKIEEYAARLGVENLLNKKAENCSYGERQRSAIVRSLVNPTDFLIYDECFSHLDLNNKKIAFSLINEVSQESGSSVIFFELNEFPFEHEYQILHL
ncbi:putative ABC transport system ATP-binding protein [Chryseobacterium ginsenosidimutans]|uniref:ATP-binding cassette domain-containing protein n=1 Tax=Chryseobacterium ginsenosidimutans TaxID=687846 RepID=UPI00277D702A|nr:ATP-binding cassette domain-containing protein [Chryseobacterium ginsenosidimutans]MDQ0592415.1 putative ABC transport system ATP-binding protein [Chryseobacterium ginsenosidimutans]